MMTIDGVDVPQDVEAKGKSVMMKWVKDAPTRADEAKKATKVVKKETGSKE